MNRRTHF